MKKSYILKLSPFAFLVLFLVFFILIPDNSQAETKFISGILIVSIRDNIEKPFKNIATVRTGDQVEVLEENDRFARIKTRDNIEGWVSVHSLQTEAPKYETIARLKEEIAALKKKNDQYSAGQANSQTEGGFKEDQRKTLTLSIDSFKTENKRLLEENQKLLGMIQDRSAQAQTSDKGEAGVLKEKVAALQNKLDVLTSNSKDIINITKERDSLAGEIEPLRTELTRARELNQKLEAENMIYWFFAGAVVFFIGLLSSKIFTRRKNKLSF